MILLHNQTARLHFSTTWRIYPHALSLRDYRKTTNCWYLSRFQGTKLKMLPWVAPSNGKDTSRWYHALVDIITSIRFLLCWLHKALCKETLNSKVSLSNFDMQHFVSGTVCCLCNSQLKHGASQIFTPELPMDILLTYIYEYKWYCYWCHKQQYHSPLKNPEIFSITWLTVKA